MKLTRMQQRYIWLAGSFPSHIVVQGQGRRTPKLRYALDDDGDEKSVIIFGYGTPLYFMVNRGIFRKLQAPHSYTLTEIGEAQFRQMLVEGTGGFLNEEIQQSRVAPRTKVA